MVLVRRWHSLVCVPRAGRGLAALGVCLALGACASGNGPAPLSLAEPSPAAAKDNKQATIADKSELAKATEWWGAKYAANTRDLEAALNYARNLKAMGVVVTGGAVNKSVLSPSCSRHRYSMVRTTSSRASTAASRSTSIRSTSPPNCSPLLTIRSIPIGA